MYMIGVYRIILVLVFPSVFLLVLTVSTVQHIATIDSQHLPQLDSHRDLEVFCIHA